MSLIVEDGTTVSGAAAYITVADADAYLASYGKDAVWSTKSVNEKEILLRSSRLYMDTKYTWKGTQATGGHSTIWPRSGVYIEDNLISSVTIPADISNSNALLAADAASSDLYRNIDNGSTGQLIQSTEDAVGPLKSSISYFDSPTSNGTQIAFTEVNSILKPYTIGGGRQLERS